MPHGTTNEPAGTYEQLFSGNDKIFRIHIAKSNLTNPDLVITILAHELAHVKLLGGKFVSQQDPNMEPLTDLTSIYFGFGVFFANTCQNKQGIR